MKKIRPYFLLFLMSALFLTLNSNAQSYDKKVVYDSLGTWNHRTINNVSADNISISSYVTKQKVLTYANFETTQKTVANLPKFRYELILVSNSRKNNLPTKTWLYNARVFIDSVEVTHEQFPRGFTAIVDTQPTIIYWYESSRDTINIKITWESSNYFQNK